MEIAMNEQLDKAKLFAKLASVMGAVRTLKKDGRNQFDKYDYLTADSISIRIGELLAEKGVAFLPSIINVETNEYQTQKGGTNFRSVVTIQATFACAETGATWTSLWLGEAIDRSDKSVAKAAVSAIKYALTKTFLLAGGDEEDADAASPVVETRQQAPQPPATGNRAPAPNAPHRPPVTPTEADGTPPHQRLWGQGMSVFGPDWDMARPWLIAKWSAKVSPDNTRNSASELNDDERDQLADYIKANAKALQGIWVKQKGAMLQST